ncbi:MAG: hypothetical protein O2782_08840 [bacterium]|nr:hypothetical protein [bacterium]
MPLAASVEPLLGRGFGIAVHRYYYLVFEVLAVVAWLSDTIPVRNPHDQLKRWELPLVTVSTGVSVWMIATPATNFLRLLPRSQPTNADYDNSLLLLQLILLLPVIVWCARRTPLARARPAAIGPIGVGLFACCCFAAAPVQLQSANRSMPFIGAHEWLAAHAETGDVALTLPPEYGLYDYIPLYSRAKLYYNPYASRLVSDHYEREYRKSVYFALYCGVLDQPVPISAPLAERLREFRLDYVLAWKGPLNDRWRQQVAPQLPPLQGPVDVSVRRQLAPLAEVVFEDDTCVLLRLPNQ